MKHLFVLILVLFTVLPTFSQEDNSNTKTETTTYYFIRHAEKDRSDKTNKNPHLTEVGKTRAQHWNAILSHVTFDAIYSTNYNRTKETAQPTATKNNLEVTIYNPRNLNDKVFIEETKGKTVLIVGHSNTTPMFVNAVIGTKKHKQIDDNNNSNLYIVTIMNDKISDQVLVIN